MAINNVLDPLLKGGQIADEAFPDFKLSGPACISSCTGDMRRAGPVSRIWV